MRSRIVILVVSVLALLQPAAADCPNGWSHYDTSCYRLSHDVESWLDAMDVCQMDKAYLVEINSAKENNYIKGLLAARNFVAWAGGNDILLEGQWQWFSSSSNFTYVNWGPSQPDNARHLENCMTIDQGGHWNDADCSIYMQYVCELQLPTSAQIIG